MDARCEEMVRDELALTNRSTVFDDLERQQQHLYLKPNPGSDSLRTQSTAFLDGLRGLSALFVFIQHYVGSFDGNVHEHGFGEGGNYYLASFPFLRIVFSGGSAAVAIFFVLSGYVLSKSPLRLFRDGELSACGKSLISAIIRRPIRLYLPPLGVTLVYAILMHAPFSIVPEVAWPKPQDSVGMELRNWLVQSVLFFNPFRTHGSDQAWFPYSLVAWTIPIELKGSILIYVLTAIFAFSGLSPSLSLILLAISSVVALQLGYWTMSCFVAGLCLAFLDTFSVGFLHHLKQTQQSKSILRHACFVIGFYLICQPAHAGHPEYSLNTPGWFYLTILTPRVYGKEQYYRYWHSLGALLVVYSSLRLDWLQRFLNSRSLRYLGKVSFMLYLVHLPLMAILGDRLGRLFGKVINLDPETASWWDNRLYIPDIGPAAMSSRFVVCMLILLSVSLVVADLATRLLDIPSVKAGKWLVRKLEIEKDATGRRKDMEVGGHGQAPWLPGYHSPLPMQSSRHIRI